MQPTRTIQKFDPWHELRTRWPEWRVTMVPMTTGEVWLRREKMILLPAEDSALVRLSLAHVCGHLAMEHDIGDTWFSQVEEAEAAWWAEMQLG